jgi:hypothetical protein
MLCNLVPSNRPRLTDMKNFLSKTQLTVVLIIGTVTMNSCKVIEPFDPTPYAMENQEKQTPTYGISGYDQNLNNQKVSGQEMEENTLISGEGQFLILTDSIRMDK